MEWVMSIGILAGRPVVLVSELFFHGFGHAAPILLAGVHTSPSETLTAGQSRSAQCNGRQTVSENGSERGTGTRACVRALPVDPRR